MSTTEQDIQRVNTTAFIDAHSVEVVLIPRTRGKSSTGTAMYVDGTARAPQICRLISMSFNERPAITVDGVERIATYTLLLEWDAIVARNDYFVIGGVRYEVIEFVPYNGYEIRALVDAHG
jgi:hypothetical protein